MSEKNIVAVTKTVDGKKNFLGEICLYETTFVIQSPKSFNMEFDKKLMSLIDEYLNKQ